MSSEKILEKKWIKQRSGECFSTILHYLEKQKIITKNNKLLKFVRSEAESRFKLSCDEAYPMNFVVGKAWLSSWKAKSCYCLDITSDENGYLKLSSPEATFFFCDFTHKDIQTDFSVFRKFEIIISEITNTYGELPENCEALPAIVRSTAGAKHKFVFTCDNYGDGIVYIEYCCYEDKYSDNNSWEWINPNYIDQRSAEERERYSVEAAEAYEREYKQALATNPYKCQAYSISLTISDIYIHLYGEVSDEPALVEAYQREYNAAQYGHLEYRNKIKALEKMRAVKRKYPNVDYPSINEIDSEIRYLEPLDLEDSWRAHLRY